MGNPFRVYERSGNGQENTGELCDRDAVYMYFWQKLYNLAVNRYTWENLPEYIEPFFLESVLISDGLGAFVYDSNVDMFAFMRCNLAGMPDIYNIPGERYAYAVTGYFEKYGKDNSVIVRTNPLMYPERYTIALYAQTLTNLWLTREMNVYAQRTPVVIAATDAMKLTYANIASDYHNFVPIIRVEDTVDLDRLKTLDLKPPNVFAAIEQQIRNVKMQALIDLGIESYGTDKKERLVAEEAHGNTGETEAMRKTGLDCRQRACDGINALWPEMGISVRYNTDLKTMINGFIGEGGAGGEGQNTDSLDL